MSLKPIIMIEAMDRSLFLSEMPFKYIGDFAPFTGKQLCLDKQFGLIELGPDNYYPVLSVGHKGFTLMKTHLPQRRIFFTDCVPIDAG